MKPPSPQAMGRRTAPCLLLALALLAPAAAAQPRLDLDRLMHEALSETLASGAVVAVVQGDRLLLLEAYGRTGYDPSAPAMTADAIFRAGGASELVTALAALRLGLDLSAPVAAYVTEAPPALGTATLGHLLTHTGGVAVHPAVPGREGADDLGSAARRLTRLDRVAPAGAIYSHSPAGIALAGLVLERAARRPFADAVREHVFEPLGMSGATFDFAAAQPRLVPGYDPGLTVASPYRRVEPVRDSAWAMPVRGLYATASDLAGLAAALLSGGGQDAAGAAIFETRTRTPAPSPVEVGLGVRIGRWNERRSVRILGGDDGHGMLMHVLPEEQLGVIVLTNKSDGLLAGVADHVLRRLLGLPEPQRSGPPPAANPDPAVLAELAAHPGSYANGGEVVEIGIVGGLPVMRSGELALEIRPLDGATLGAFMDGRQALRFTFVRDAEGRPYLWIGNRVLGREGS